MQTAVFWGSSDDLIEIEGIKGADEFGSGTSNKIKGTFALRSKSNHDVMKIYVLYDGCWSFAISLEDEGIPLPDWPVRIGVCKNGYSTRMEIDVPDDVFVEKTTNR